MGTLNLNEQQVDLDHQGRPKKIRGEMALPKAKTLESSVKDFMKSNAAELQLNIDPSTLKVVHKAETPIGEILRYQQMVNDIPVLNSYVVVQTQEGNIKEFNFGHVNDVKINTDAKSKKNITPADAYAKAMDSLDKVNLRDKKIEPSLAYFSSDSGLILAYRVLITTQDPIHDWSIIVDAATGAILEKEDIIQEFPDGAGLVFDPNPVVTAHNNALRQPGATTGGCGYTGSTVAALDAQRVSRTLKGIKLSGGVYSLDGPYAKVVNISAPNSAIPTATVATAFNYSQSDDRLGAVNSYYHIDTIQRYIQSLGITTANNRQTSIDPIVSGSSAYYSPVNKSLHMGSLKPCGPDKCQEGDAILHEYGHAIQDNQVPGWGVTNPVTHRAETRAMGEGFGDILACVFFANFGNQFQREVFEDWAYSYNGSAGLRRVDGTKTYANWANEEHADGEIWSAALWNIYRTIGGDSLVLSERQAARDALLKTVIVSHHLLATSASMADGAEAVMKTNAQLPEYRGKHLMKMLNSFHNRGLLTCSTAADLFIREATTDTGAEPFTGSVFWESPDLWVRKNDDNGTTHQSPEHGQDNYFYARVKNRGTATARAFVVTFNVKPWAGTQFVYPNDFVPFISANCGFNLAPGASVIIKAKWPAAMLPPTGTHACLLGQVYMPTDVSAAGAHVWDKNNLAQKNMTVVDAIPGDTIMAQFQIGNLQETIASLFNIELARPPRGVDIHTSLLAINAFETKKLFNSAAEWKQTTPAHDTVATPTIKFSDHSTIELSGHGIASSAFRLNVAPGSSIGFSHPDAAETKLLQFEKTARLGGTAQLPEIEFFAGKLAGLPVVIQSGSQITCTLKVYVPKEATPGDTLDFRIAQRNTKGQVVGGITVQVNVIKKQ